MAVSRRARLRVRASRMGGRPKTNFISFKFPVSHIVNNFDGNGRQDVDREELISDVSKLPQCVKDQINFFIEHTYLLTLREKTDALEKKIKITYNKTNHISVKVKSKAGASDLKNAIEMNETRGYWNTSRSDDIQSWSPCWPINATLTPIFNVFPPDVEGVHRSVHRLD